ncbi:MAG TPA: formylglycine-generating enzyme family protein [Desulfotignum sp.]|nr:formylglycine-generating enzyme family protein [Desulfotignum sp.]
MHFVVHRFVQTLFSLCIVFLCMGNALAEEPRIYTNQIGMRFVLIPAGTFVMGSPPSEKGRQKNEKQHRVSISKSFYMGETEVTQGQWNRLASPNPSAFKLGNRYPVDSVTWHEAMQFISFLNKLENTDRYRLPTEAEWEYACRAGSTTAFSTGPITTISCVDPEPALINTAWYCYNSGLAGPPRDFKPHPVKLLQPNAWGLFDMHGNVQEWVLDACKSRSLWKRSIGPVTDTYQDNMVDPLEKNGDHRVVRGGGWFQNGKYQRSAFRSFYKPVAVRNSLGFRVVLRR